MAQQTLPAIDQTAYAAWTEQQRDLYSHLPFWLANMQVKKRKQSFVWEDLCQTIPWKPNLGEIMKGVTKEPSPVTRQEAFPAALSAAAMHDIIDVRERVDQAVVRHHKFKSPVFQFYPSFRDFMTDHVKKNSEDIMEKQRIYNNMFIRSGIFHYSKFMWVADKATTQLIECPNGVPSDSTGTGAKTVAFRQAQIPLIGNPGNLSLKTVNMALTCFAEDLGVPAYSGEQGKEVSKLGLNESYILVTSSEAWNQFIYDPFLIQMKTLDLNVYTGPFKGNLFGRATCWIERYPLRMAADGTFPAPEVRVVGTNNSGSSSENSPTNVGETIVNPAYYNAPYEFAFLIGAPGYETIRVGPPPSEFASGGMPDGFGKLSWNGEIRLTKNFLIPGVDANGASTWETNEFGEYLKLISHVTYGLFPMNRRYVLPILFKRVRGAVS